MSNIVLSFQNASICTSIPSEQQFQLWAEPVATLVESDIEVCLRIVDEEEMSKLNQQYRAKNGPTNVLTFVADIPPQVESNFAGDIVICANVVEQEAKNQHKAPLAHWAHLLVHGLLHMLGYDHIDNEDADIMEALETKFITGLNYPAPYTHSLGDTTN